MRYRKKLVVVDAWQFNGEGFYDWPEWLRQKGFNICSSNIHNGFLVISTLEGEMRCSKGDWIIRGIKGEIYPCKPDIFELTYEAIE